MPYLIKREIALVSISWCFWGRFHIGKVFNRYLVLVSGESSEAVSLPSHVFETIGLIFSMKSVYLPLKALSKPFFAALQLEICRLYIQIDPESSENYISHYLSGSILTVRYRLTTAIF